MDSRPSGTSPFWRSERLDMLPGDGQAAACEILAGAHHPIEAWRIHTGASEEDTLLALEISEREYRGLINANRSGPPVDSIPMAGDIGAFIPQAPDMPEPGIILEFCERIGVNPAHLVEVPDCIHPNLFQACMRVAGDINLPARDREIAHTVLHGHVSGFDRMIENDPALADSKEIIAAVEAGWRASEELRKFSVNVDDIFWPHIRQIPGSDPAVDEWLNVHERSLQKQIRHATLQHEKSTKKLNRLNSYVAELDKDLFGDEENQKKAWHAILMFLDDFADHENRWEDMNLALQGVYRPERVSLKPCQEYWNLWKFIHKPETRRTDELRILIDQYCDAERDRCAVNQEAEEAKENWARLHDSYQRFRNWRQDPVVRGKVLPMYKNIRTLEAKLDLRENAECIGAAYRWEQKGRPGIQALDRWGPPGPE